MSPTRFGPLPAAIALALGIAIAPLVGPGWLPWAIAAAACLIAPLGGRWRPAWFALAVVAAGAGRGARDVPALPGSDDRVVDRVVGVVGGPVVRSARGTGAPLDTGAAVIWLWADVPLVPGERIAATGYLRIPRGLLDPAMPDRADSVASRGADHELVAQHVERLDDEAGPTAWAWRWAGDLQQRWARTIDEAGGDPVGRAALRGIVVGDRGDVPDALDRRWRAVGIYHVLSVSGLHLAVVAGLVFAALCRLIAASPWGGRVRPAAWAAPPALVLAIGYTLVTGAQLATLRALVVVALAMIAAMLDRPMRLIDALGFAALAILAWRPLDLFDPSFQLSFTAALTLAIRPRVPRAVTDGRLRAATAAIGRGIATSAWVALTTAPITAFHFQQVAAGGVIGNLVLTPPVELIALPVTLAGLVLGLPPLVAAAAWLVALVDRGAELLARIMPVGTIAVASMTTMTVLVALSMCLALRPGRRIAAIAWLALCLAWSRARLPAPPGALRVTFLDVGQGDAAIVELPDGATWLVDAGGLVGARDLAAQTAPGLAVTRVLQAYAHDHVDLAIISHPHPDHYLGLASLGVPVDELWSATEPEPAKAGRPRDTLPSFDAIARTLGARRVHPPLGVARREAGVELEVWAPRFQAAEGEPLIEAADPVRTVNDNSLVVAIHYAGRTIVFAGDLEAEGEDALVDAGLLHVDVVKVAHHGSPTSSTARFVAATHPALAVISCGRGNHFGFPSAEVIARWRAAGAEIARTDTDGAITVSIDSDGALAIDRFARRFIPPAAP